MRPRSPLTTALQVLLALALGSVPAVVAAAPAGATGSATLTIAEFAFSPQTLTIPADTTVTVFNQDVTEHTFSSDPGDAQQWDSGPIAPGSSFSVTFRGPGSFGYHCNIHSSMVGTIVVVAAPPTTVAPATTTSTTTTGATTPTTRVVDSVTPTAVTAPLPRTGASATTTLVAIAGVSVLSGAAMLASGRRRRRQRRA